jgi:hypothetical protein
MSLDPITATLLTTAALMLVTLLRRLGQRGWSRARRLQRRERLDTVAAWPPHAARVLADAEIEALQLARRCVPGTLVLAQVPLWRFVRISSGQSYARWLARAGHLNADLLVCDARAQVLAVIDLAAEPMSERSLRRHRRLRRVLKNAGLPVLVWQLGKLPSLVKARAEFRSLGIEAPSSRDASPHGDGWAAARPLPELDALLSVGDELARRPPVEEAVASDFYGLHAPNSTLL